MKMASPAKKALLGLLVLNSPSLLFTNARLSDYVDPLIGTVGPTAGSAIAGGNSFPGASLPWSMAKPGIDTSYLGVPNSTAVDCNAGYTPLGNVTGISMTHVSGTGGAPTYGLISQMPILGDLSKVNLADNTTYWQNRSLDSEEASVGLFRTTLQNGIQIEIAGSNHSGLLRYTFPSVTTAGNDTSVADPTDGLSNNAEDAHVLVDLTHVLPAYSSWPYSQRFLHGELHLQTTSDGKPSYYGAATYTGGWSQPESHNLYFCGNFSSSGLVPTSEYVSQNAQSGVPGAGIFSWSYSPVTPPAFSSRPTPRSYNDVKVYMGSGNGIGALFSWTPSSPYASAPRVVESRLGISYISFEQACANVAKELPANMTLEDAVEQAKVEWEEKILSKVEIGDDGSASNQNDTLKRMLYTALYQTGLMPTDKTGENPYWPSSEAVPYYDDHYTIW
jgi:putative alpha-1,2-mannosidase